MEIYINHRKRIERKMDKINDVVDLAKSKGIQTDPFDVLSYVKTLRNFDVVEVDDTSFLSVGKKRGFSYAFISSQLPLSERKVALALALGFYYLVPHKIYSKLNIRIKDCCQFFTSLQVKDCYEYTAREFAVRLLMPSDNVRSLLKDDIDLSRHYSLPECVVNFKRYSLGINNKL